MKTRVVRIYLALATLAFPLGVVSSAPGDQGGLFGANLLANPGFEDYYNESGSEWQNGDSVQYALQIDQNTSRGVQGWRNAGFDMCSIRTDGPGTGHSGNYFGMGGRFAGGAGATAVMEQIVDLLACGFDEAELDGWSLLLSAGAFLSSYPGDNDTAGLTVLFLDEVFAENGTALATGQQDDDIWVEYRADDVAVPSGTRYIRFVAAFTKVDGTNNDGRVDDAWVRISPTISPAPMLDRNLLANPGFESGTGGWNTLLGNVRVRVDGADGVPSYSGGYLLFGGQTSLSPDGARASALQSIDLMSHGFSAALLDDPDAELFLQVGGWLYSSPGTPAAQAKYTLGVYDSTGGLLASYDAGRVDSAQVPRARRHEMPLPVGTRNIVFRYDSLDRVGVNLDGYLDDASVVITSTPHPRTRGGPVAVGHRGNRIVGPENTVAAFVAARDEAQFVEFDLRQCATGEFVVMHDDTVDRTTDGTGEVALMTLAELQALDAGSCFSADFAGEPVPTIGQAIAAILPDTTPLIERKTGPSSALVSELQKLGVEQDVVVQSFNWTFLSEMNALDPSIRLAALGSGVLDAAKVTSIQATGTAIVAWAGSDVTATEAALVHAAGMELFVWTINNPADLDDFIALGVDGIITDDPGAVSWRSDPYAQPNDLDDDGDVDLHDFALYQVSFVDLQDFAQFRTAFTGPR